MKLKSSNKKAYLLIGGLVLFAISLYLFKTNLVTKSSKYLSAPEGIVQKTELDFIQLSFNEKNYKKLKQKRDKALSVGILETSDSDYVSATVTFNGVEYRAEVRLKGDWTDHLRGDKWSFRIKLKGDETIMGMRKFSIHRPGSRGFINEWLYHKAIKKEELIGLRYNFLEGAIHVKKDDSNSYINKEVGIYAIEESFDKRTIESNKRKESIILKFSEAGFWANVKIAKQAGNPSGVDWKKLMDYKVDFPITVFGEDKVLADSTLNNYFKTSKNLLEDLRSKRTTIDQVFDVKELALQNAILNLFGATHGIPLINVRFYYNPITSKLEPIAFDGNSGAKLIEYMHFAFVNHQKDDVYFKELAHAIHKVVQPDYFDNLIEVHKKELDRYKKILKTEFKVMLLKESIIRQNRNVLIKERNRLIAKYNIADIESDFEVEENAEAKSFIIPDIKTWRKNNINLSKANVKRNAIDAFKIERISANKPAYAVIRDIPSNYGKAVQAIIIVKKGAVGNHFGLKLQGQYPDRADAVFNLSNGTLKGVKKAGGFENESATIKSLGNGWFELKITAKVNTTDVKLIFGPTDNTKSILQWEGSTNNKSNSYIDVSSISVKQID